MTATLPALLCTLSLAMGTDDHLAQGAAYFRAGRFAEALVEFRVAARLGASDGEAYAGATLMKLDRFDEALEAFAASGPPGRDGLLDYYRALACHGAGLYRCADQLLAGLAGRAGPKLEAQADRIRAELAPVLRDPPPELVVRITTRCRELRSGSRKALAERYCAEADALEKRSPSSRRITPTTIVAGGPS